MSNISIGAGLALDGEKEFKKAVQNINKDIKVLGTEMGKVTAQFGTNKDSIEALTAKSEVYKKTIVEQSSKVDILKKSLENAKKEFGENSDKVKDWQMKLNRAEAELYKTENALNDTTKQINEYGNESKQTGTQVEKAGKQAKDSGDDAKKGESGWSKLGEGLSNAGKHAAKAIAALAGATAAAAAAIGTMTVKSAYAADDINTMAKQTGLSTEEIQKFQFASEQIDVPIETLTGSLAKLTRNMQTAKEAGGSVADTYEEIAPDAAKVEAATLKLAAAQAKLTELQKSGKATSSQLLSAQAAITSAQENLDKVNTVQIKVTNGKEAKAAALAFEELGINILDVNGELRSNQDVFAEALDALGKMENETQRDAYAMQIFGKSAQDLNPLILGGADTLKQLGDQAEAAGLILGQDALDNLNSLADAIDTFKATVSGSGNLFSTAFASPIAGAVNTVTGYIQELAKSFTAGGFEALSDKIGEIITDIVNKINEALPKIIDFGLNIINKIVEGITQNIPALTETVITVADKLVKAFLDMLPMLVKAGIKAIISLMKGIAKALPDLIVKIVETVESIVDIIFDNLDEFIDAGIAVLMALIDGIVKALPKLISLIPKIIIKIIQAFTNNMPKLLESAAGIINAIIQGILISLPLLIKSLPKIITAITEFISKNLTAIVNSAVDIMMALIDGLIQAIPILVESLPEIIAAILDFFFNNIPVIIEAGFQLMVGLGKGMLMIMANLKPILESIVEAIVRGLATQLIKFSQFGKTAMEWIGNSMNENASWFGDNAFNIGRMFIEKLWSGITDKFKWLMDNIKELSVRIVDGTKEFFGIKSPSTVFAGIGGYMAEGLGKGFTSEMSEVEKKMRRSVPTNFDLKAKYNNSMAENIVNGLNTVLSVQSNRNITVQMPPIVLNGREVSKALLIPLKDEVKRSGMALA